MSARIYADIDSSAQRALRVLADANSAASDLINKAYADRAIVEQGQVYEAVDYVITQFRPDFFSLKSGGSATPFEPELLWDDFPANTVPSKLQQGGFTPARRMMGSVGGPPADALATRVELPTVLAPANDTVGAARTEGKGCRVLYVGADGTTQSLSLNGVYELTEDYVSVFPRGTLVFVRPLETQNFRLGMSNLRSTTTDGFSVYVREGAFAGKTFTQNLTRVLAPDNLFAGNPLQSGAAQGWVESGGSQIFAAGAGITISGQTIALDASLCRKYSETRAIGASQVLATGTITHNLNSLDVQAKFRDLANQSVIDAVFTVVDSNSISYELTSAGGFFLPANIRATIFG